jgi:prepilin-type N-terminal cleavage/methylation domain-containing protein
VRNGRAVHADAAFTLIEMLVVLTIISILAGLTMVGIQKARKYGEEKAARTELVGLASRIESFNTAMGDYPPSSLADIKIATNGINDGNESLFAFLLSRKGGGPFADDLKEDRWVNADNDELTPKGLKTVTDEIQWTRGNAKLLEYVDLWRSPFVYIHSRDYNKKFRYQGEDGSLFEVEAQKNPATGTYFAPTSYQLWSLGTDGVNPNGGGDDIASWKS